MRIATYNVEWFDSLFDDAGELILDGGWSGRRDVTRRQQTEALGLIFRQMDADGIMVIEAPDSSRRRSGTVALENFAEAFGLRARRAVIGHANDTQQEIIFLHDPDRIEARHDPRDSPAVPRFDSEFRVDLDVDGLPDGITWSKPPLELACRARESGRSFRLIGVHAKSKAPHGARNEKHATRLAIENRRKQLAQCVWLRGRVDEHLAACEPLMVLGDLNDGPGLDEYELLFGRSGVEIVMGDGEGPRLYDPHARRALAQRLPALPSTARFQLPPDEHGAPMILSALLDYILISPDLLVLSPRPRWQILHPFDNPAVYADAALRDALLAASDHFPVLVDLPL